MPPTDLQPLIAAEPIAGFGRCVGQPLSAIPDKDLEWLQSALQRSIADSSRVVYKAKNEKQLAEVSAELRGRRPA